MNRRQFIQAGAAGVFLASNRAYSEEFAQKTRRVGLIGSGWYGKCDVFRLIQVAPVEVVSICDVDKKMLDGAAEMIAQRQASKKRPRTYTDYRELLKEKDLDIVLVETPDHWHALPMIEAVKSGADVWVQKPIGVDIVEGQAMVAAARKYGRVVQVNTQRRSTTHLEEARDIIQQGKLGKIAMVETYCYYHMRARGNPPDQTPPDHLDWNMWTGPAPLRQYNPIAHPRGWRAFMEYGNGILGDMCVHMLDMVRWMMNLGYAKEVHSEGGILVDPGSKANITDTQTASFDFGETKVVWQHRSWGRANDPEYPWAATFYGDKGTLKASVMKYDFIPMQGSPVHKDVKYELEEFPEDKTEKDLEQHVAPAIRKHWKNFLRNVDSRGRPVADIEEAHKSTTACILANLSLDLGRSLVWDSDKHRIVGDDAANRRLKRPYRKPWVHPDPKNV